MTDQPWEAQDVQRFWCAFNQLTLPWHELSPWPIHCPLCGRAVSEYLSTHHSMLAEDEDAPWGEF